MTFIHQFGYLLPSSYHSFDRSSLLTLFVRVSMVELRRVMISGRDGQLSRPSGSVAPNIICMVTVVRCAANLRPRARHTATLRGGGKWLLQSG